MKIDIQATSFTLTDGLRAHVERRINFAMAHRSSRVRRISVRLSDLNGPKGGIDKRCLVNIKANGLPDIVVEDTEKDLDVAVDRAIARAKRTLGRRQDRAQRIPKGQRAVVTEEEAA